MQIRHLHKRCFWVQQIESICMLIQVFKNSFIGGAAARLLECRPKPIRKIKGLARFDRDIVSVRTPENR